MFPRYICDLHCYSDSRSTKFKKSFSGISVQPCGFSNWQRPREYQLMREISWLDADGTTDRQ